MFNIWEYGGGGGGLGFRVWEWGAVKASAAGSGTFLKLPKYYIRSRMECGACVVMPPLPQGNGTPFVITVELYHSIPLNPVLLMPGSGYTFPYILDSILPSCQVLSV